MTEQEKRERQLIAEFAAAASAGDRERFCKTFEPLGLLDGWQRAFRAVAKVSAPDDFRTWLPKCGCAMAIPSAATSTAIAI